MNPDVTDDRLAELAAALDIPRDSSVGHNPDSAGPSTEANVAEPAPPASSVPFVRRAQRAARRRSVAAARSVVGRVSSRVARDVFAHSAQFSEQMAGAITERAAVLAPEMPVAELRAEVVLLRAELSAARQEIAALATVGRSVDALTVNAELAKAQVLAVSAELDQLGWAIAPGAGPVGAADRLAELRLRLNELDRRVRLLASTSTSTSTSEQPAADAAAPAAQPAVAAFDYSGFEFRFRGDPDLVRTALVERYGDLLAKHQPVLDVGCGRGELIEGLVARGIDARGIELDHAMADAARSRGLDVVLGDALEHLRALPPASLGAIISIHVAEHLPLDSLLALFDLARSRLRPGGLLVLETPNPTSLIVLGNSYVMDPTHVRPLHPSLMTFLAEGAGFDDVRLRFYEPATGYHLPRLTLDDDAPPWAHELDAGLGRLNEVLFGAQEYALVARTPSA